MGVDVGVCKERVDVDMWDLVWDNCIKWVLVLVLVLVLVIRYSQV